MDYMETTLEYVEHFVRLQRQPWPEIRDFIQTQDFPVAKAVRVAFDDDDYAMDVVAWLALKYKTTDAGDAGQREHIITSLFPRAALDELLSRADNNYVALTTIIDQYRLMHIVVVLNRRVTLLEGLSIPPIAE